MEVFMPYLSKGNPTSPSVRTLSKELQRLPGSTLTFKEKGPPFASVNESRIYSKDADRADVFFVYSGMIRLENLPHFDKKVIYDFRGEGEFFGDIFGTGHYTEDAAAITDVSLRRISREVLLDNGFEGFLHKTAEATVVRQMEVRDMLASGFGIYERMLITLFILGHRYKDQYKESDNVITLPLRHQDIADYIGSTRESTSSNLTIFRRHGAVIQSKNRSVTIDLHKITKLYEDL